VQDVGEENKDGRRIEMKKPARPRPCGSGKSILVGLVRREPPQCVSTFLSVDQVA
jgi:hypothetical protein